MAIHSNNGFNNKQCMTSVYEVSMIECIAKETKNKLKTSKPSFKEQMATRWVYDPQPT